MARGGVWHGKTHDLTHSGNFGGVARGVGLERVVCRSSTLLFGMCFDVAGERWLQRMFVSGMQAVELLMGGNSGALRGGLFLQA